VAPPNNKSLPPAMLAKAQLEAFDWKCNGRAYVNPADQPLTIGSRSWSGMQLDIAAITASRGDESLVITWVDGECVSQQYSLWDVKQPAKPKHGIPPHRLPFDPVTISDSDLIVALNGMRVTWWNSLGGNEESAVVSPMNKGVVSITHYYTTAGKEVRDLRTIQFIDYSGSGFKAFYLAALLKVGK
jgi:hypothetical protein